MVFVGRIGQWLLLIELKGGMLMGGEEMGEGAARLSQ
jgi:hypothetical protein